MYLTVDARTDIPAPMTTQSHGLLDHSERKYRHGRRTRYDQDANLARWDILS
jgi:hypothetical protein